MVNRFSIVPNRVISALIFLIITISLYSFRPKSDYGNHRIFVTISNIRDESGFIHIQVYRDQTSFSKEKPYRNLFFSKKGKVKEGKMNVVIGNLPDGPCGLALCDDENGNKKMDFSFMIPTEGFGFSDYYHTSWSRPQFDDFKFVLTGDRKSFMKIRYI